MLTQAVLPPAQHFETGSPRAPHVPDHAMLRLIGRGSYGEVWLARNAIGALRAVKVVRRSEFKEERPFLRELSGIQKYEPVSRAHEGLIDILQVGRNDTDGFYYAIMELADSMHGQDLENYEPRTLTNVLRERGRLPVAECVPLFMSLAGALSFMHERGLVHRDVKPSNIIFVEGAAKLADIGLVAAESDAASYVGTEGFIPPEGPGSRLADIYALGKVFYEAATGLDRTEFPTLPIDASSYEANRDLLELNAVIVKACESHPSDRYQSAVELHADLALLQSGKSVKGMRLAETRLKRARQVGAVVMVAAIFAVGVGQVFRYKAQVANENFHREEQLRLRAEKAETAAREELWHSQISEARALRSAGLAGRRFAALTALTNAAKVRVDASVRSEVAACLSLIDVRALDLGRRFEPHRQILCWASDMERYAEALANGEVLIRNARDHSIVRKIPSSPGPVIGSLEFTPAETGLVVVFADGTKSLWNLATEPVVKGWPRNTAFDRIAFTPDDRILALANEDNIVRSFDMKSGQMLSQFTAGFDFSGLKIRPDGEQIGVCSEAENTVEIWAWKEKKVVQTLKPRVGVYTFEWNEDGSIFAASTVDYRIHIWDTQLWEEKQVLSGHQGQVIELDFLAGDSGLFSISWDGTARLWNVHAGIALWRLSESGAGAHYNPRTRRLGFKREDYSNLALFELVPDFLARQLLQPIPANFIGPNTGSFTSDGRFLAVGAHDGMAVWDLAKNAIVGRSGNVDLREPVFDPINGLLYISGAKGLTSVRMEIEEGNRIEFGASREILPGRAFYLGSSTNGTLAWYDREQLHIRHPAGQVLSWRPNQPGLEGLAISPDAKWLATGTRNGRGVRVWDATTGTFIREHPSAWGGHAAFSPDSARLLCGSSEDYALWDRATGNLVWRIPRHNAGGLNGRAAFSPDGRTIAVADSRSIIKLVEAATGREIISLEHSILEIISRLIFSPDGNTLAALCETHVIQVWDLNRLHRELAKLNLDWINSTGN